MKKFVSMLALVGVFCLCVSRSSCFSVTLDFGNLFDKLQDIYVKPLAKDVGSILGGGMFHSGRTLGTVLGVEAGISASTLMKPNEDDVILKNKMSEKPFGLPYIQLSKGLPYKIDLTLRGFPETQGVKLFGVGVKYGIIEKEIAVIKAGLSAMYSFNRLQYADFKANTNSLAGILSVKIPLIEPYFGIAIDTTKLETNFTAAKLVVAPAGANANVNVSVSEIRYVLGANYSLLPFTYINAAVTYSVGRYGVDLGAGLKF